MTPKMPVIITRKASVPMPDQITIRPYAGADEAAVVRTWNAAMFADPITTTTFRAKVLLDPNFDPEGCLVAEVGGEVRGFVLSIVRRVPFFAMGYMEEQSWITAMGVDPAFQRQGIGTSLLEAAETRLRGLGRKSIAISPYVPNYFTPGPDVNAYAHGIEFLTNRGFEVLNRPLSMRNELTDFRLPDEIVERTTALAAEGIEVRPARPDDIVPVLDFLVEHFDWEWHREASDIFNSLYNGDGRHVGMLVVTKGEEMLGYAQYRNERFGPFGVRPDLRSQGIGRVLLTHTLRQMRASGFHVAWFLWTSDQAAKLYARYGFHEVRRFAVLRKALGA
jgi:GNAT superfamily N-acetyltransferase